MSDTGPKALRTARLVLRPLAALDVDALHPILTSTSVRRFLFDGETVSRDFLAAAIDASIRNFADRGWGLFGITLEDDVPQGLCGFHMVGTPAERQLVYALAPAIWGQGLGGEAVGAVVKHALDVCGMKSIVAAVDAPNTASIAILRRLGFEPEVRLVERGRDVIRHVLRG